MGNFERAVVSSAPQRLITEGVIHLHAVICTLMVLLCARTGNLLPARPMTEFAGLVKKTIVIGMTGMALSVLADWGMVRVIYGDEFAGQASKHIRFGPNATATKEKPKTGQLHP